MLNINHKKIRCYYLRNLKLSNKSFQVYKQTNLETYLRMTLKYSLLNSYVQIYVIEKKSKQTFRKKMFSKEEDYCWKSKNKLNVSYLILQNIKRVILMYKKKSLTIWLCDLNF